MARFLALAIALSSVILLAPAAYAVDPPDDVEISTCGQVVPKRTLGYLTGNLDCTGFAGGPANVGNDTGAAVYVEKKGRLDLRGFTITGGHHGVLCDALLCQRGHPCSNGPCEVFNGSLVGTFLGSDGIRGNRPVIHDVTITGFWLGVVAYSSLDLRNATVQDSKSVGVAGKALAITNTTITNSAQFGVLGYTDRGKAIRLTDSTVTGNGTAPYCTDYPCVDVAGMRFPRLVNTTCGTSFNMIVNGGNWGVCAGD